jgi:hypothetical protein
MQDLPTVEPNPYVLAIIGPDRDDVRRLISASDLYLAALYPAESNHLTDLKALASPDVTLLAVLRAGEAVGCGALVRTRPGEAELKRMFVAASHRVGAWAAGFFPRWKRSRARRNASSGSRPV